MYGEARTTEGYRLDCGIMLLLKRRYPRIRFRPVSLRDAYGEFREGPGKKLEDIRRTLYELAVVNDVRHFVAETV